MSFSLRFPNSFEELWPLLESDPPGSALPIAGGTDLLLAVYSGRWTPRVLVSLSRLPLSGIEHRSHDGTVFLGASTPLRRIERDPGVRRGLPALAEACADVGSVQLRHRATLAGNVIRASPASDLLPPLVALGAHLLLRNRRGQRTVPLEGFVRASWQTGLAPGEILEGVQCISPVPGAYLWQRVRPANDISQVGVAAVLHPSETKDRGNGGWRLVAGGTSPSVQRLTEAESCLPSPRPSKEELRAAGEAAAREAKFATDLRAAEDYRRQVLSVLVQRAVLRTMDRADPGGRK